MRPLSQNESTYRTSATSTPLWDPRDVLGVDPDEGGFTCTGTTQKGQRCRQFMISRADLNEASNLLDTIAQIPPRRGVPWEDLEDLAYLTLCPRWHRKPGYSQVGSLSSKWKRMISSYFLSVRDEELSPVRAPRIRATRSNPSPRSQPATRTTVSQYESTTVTVRRDRRTKTRTVSSRGTHIVEDNTSETSVHRTSRRTRSIEELRPTQLAVPTQPRGRLPPSPPPSTTSSRSPSRPQEPPTPIDPTPHHTSTTSTPLTSPPASPAQPQPQSQPSRPPTPAPAPNPTRPPTASLPPQRERPPRPCCPICLLPIWEREKPLRCLAQCNQHVHAACFSQWRTTCLKNFAGKQESGFFVRNTDEEVERLRRESVKCVMCRAVWEEDGDEQATDEDEDEDGSEEDEDEEPSEDSEDANSSEEDA